MGIFSLTSQNLMCWWYASGIVSYLPSEFTFYYKIPVSLKAQLGRGLVDELNLLLVHTLAFSDVLHYMICRSGTVHHSRSDVHGYV